VARERPRNGGEAYRLGQAGESAPAWVMDDPSGYFLRQFERGKANPDGAAPADPDTKPPADPAPKQHARGRRKQRPAPGRGYLAGIGKGSAAAGRPVARALPFKPPGGDAGGLLLAVVLYPVALSVIRYGGKGPGMWFRAKFLNQPASQDELRAAAGNAVVGGGGVDKYRAS
jgi:hypothetical protein